MRVCVDGTANLCCAIRKQFVYCSLQIEICRFFAWTQRELDAPGVLCSPQVRRKLITRAPNSNCSVRLWFARMYNSLDFKKHIEHKLLAQRPTTISWGGGNIFAVPQNCIQNSGERESAQILVLWNTNYWHQDRTSYSPCRCFPNATLVRC